MKTIYKVLIIVALLGVGGFALFYFFNRVTVPVPIEDQENILFPGFREIPEKTGTIVSTSTDEVVVSKFSDFPVFDFWVNYETKEVYYITNEGRVSVAKNGNDIDLNTQPLDVLNVIIPNTKGNKIIASFGDPQKPRWGIFDVIDGVWKPLPDGIASLAWGKDDSTLIGISEDGTTRALSSFDISKNPIKISTLIKDFRMRDVFFVSKNQDSLLIVEKASSLLKGRVWEFNTKNDTIKTTEKGTSGLMFLFSPLSEYALRFSNPSSLLVTDKNLEPVLPLFINTIPQKCGFGSVRMYCFVPQDREVLSKTTLPDDYFQNKLMSIDDLVSIDPETGESVTIITTGTEDFDPYDGKHIREAGSSVFFLNRYDNFVYEVRVPKDFYNNTQRNDANEPSPFN